VDLVEHPGTCRVNSGGVYAAGYLADLLLARCYGAESPKLKGDGSLISHLWSWPKSLERLRLDFRMVLIGSLLPDIIDKPLGFLLLPELVNFNTRSVGHSLSFNIMLLSSSLLLLGIAHGRVLVTLALASMSHLLLDQMWRLPERFLWPLYGWHFPRGSTTLDEWLSFQLSGEWLDPLELMGLLFLTWFAIHLYRGRAVLQFIKVGTLGGYCQNNTNSA
jgi:inner membrane protein